MTKEQRKQTVEISTEISEKAGMRLAFIWQARGFEHPKSAIEEAILLEFSLLNEIQNGGRVILEDREGNQIELDLLGTRSTRSPFPQ